MDRFVAMIWTAGDTERQAQVTHWTDAFARRTDRWACVYDAPGVKVFSRVHRKSKPIYTKLETGDGVVVGCIFRRGAEHHGRCEVIDHAESDKIGESGGAHLIDNYWGNYLAFWRSHKDNAVSVLRDPCGAIACFEAEQQGVHLLFAHADDVADLAGVSFSTDWTYLQAFTVFDHFTTAHTALAGVTEILAGERAIFGAAAGANRTFLWNAADLASNPSKQNATKAIAELRETAELCFAAWGKEYDHMLVRLSGGLDSSIVTSLMRRKSQARISAFHVLGSGYERFEAAQARLAARHNDVELIELPLPPEAFDVSNMLQTPRLARPLMQVLGAPVDAVTARLADQINADCTLAGHGGDVLFLQGGGAKHTLSDYLALNGFGRDFARIAYEAATVQRRSLWDVVGDAIDTAIFQRRWKAFGFLTEAQFLKHSPIDVERSGALPDSYLYHPWLRRARSLPRGAADQVLGVTTLYNYYMRQGSALSRDALYPLFSQPIAEFALRTPTYVLVDGALDRALERRAFADIIPTEVARRVDKGGINHHLLTVAGKNLPLLRELVLDGQLVSRGWVDRAKIELMLTPEHLAHGAGAGFLYRIIAAEVWLHAWSGPAFRVAA